ncbi:group 1 truncated hemoglobin [Hydrogenophaga sp. PAMC20947]|uniref:group I truncated hemoglobin n=1 Tax=Hydrogenophaga sp. PAMC20947 TaxID=2565558 RepID=UPI00109DC4F6|nr:group 1 truncated hemoglobin [Hydrogenophaga sp. PAMC20947]QCB48329.1 group 1 truncated hemoglobin [Hydrogenophaga sp. PAMC20947]
MKYPLNTLALSIAALLSTASSIAMAQTAAPQMPVPSAASAYPVAPAAGLYEAFGEEAGIRTLMADFVQRLRADARIGDQFKETNLANLAQQLGDQLCQLSGGPCVYKGPDMKTAHSNMDVTRAHFNALVEVLQQSMDARGIPFTRQNQMLALLAPMHRDVVNTR